MGLELGPPWLVLLEDADGETIVVFRDNFTGASMPRAISIRKNEPGSYAAVMDRHGNFARHSDGSLYDPIEETKGRNGGTFADRGHRALIVAGNLLPRETGMRRRRPWYFWPLVYLAMFFGWIIVAALI
ncbi:MULTISPECIES: hypothetical protein [Mesorhizobium]|uniref:Uncharacterized protein n=1 Tax=Mesorhizobium denitrificans TaxID=2294114 RepID=A0A371X1Z9_9HYPH|nr:MULTISPECIES: hypothetical protein [Mesorhizobium]RFC63250.1 hypothetical protein DY251_20940 [Mesorhizobium denitrificans]